MQSRFFNPKRGLGAWMLFVLLLVGLSVGSAFAGTSHDSHDKGHKNPGVDRPAWLDKFENQLDHEDLMSGLEGSQEKLDQKFMLLMDRLQDKIQEHASPASSGGGFHDSWSAHQLGQSYLLGPSEAATKVFKGAHCPSGAPVRSYDITAINVEITLNQWGDYFPGYMFVLTKDVSKVRSEEKKNAAARDDEFDGGAVSHGIQGDAIQPMSIRGNQGECVRFKVRNAVEDEDVGFQVNGSAMIISSSGLPASAASKGAIIPAGGTQDFEWHIPIDEQEGSHMIHEPCRS